MGKRESIKVITSNGSGEIVEKKSRFIANVFSVDSPAQAEAKIAATPTSSAKTANRPSAVTTASPQELRVSPFLKS